MYLLAKNEESELENVGLRAQMVQEQQQQVKSIKISRN